MNRGKKNVEDLKKLAIGEGFRRVLIVGTIKGNPSTLTFLATLPTEVQYLPLMIWLKGVSLRRELT
ncbi:MAG TPA: ribosomal biogenesis protein, partial [Candidatus Korarchaeota archaeon]|nr:ribosomal biogenesis protein [Candidatus Korarchaeota archaeon]